LAIAQRVKAAEPWVFAGGTLKARIEGADCGEHAEILRRAPGKGSRTVSTIACAKNAIPRMFAEVVILGYRMTRRGNILRCEQEGTVCAACVEHLGAFRRIVRCPRSGNSCATYGLSITQLGDEFSSRTRSYGRSPWPSPSE